MKQITQNLSRSLVLIWGLFMLPSFIVWGPGSESLPPEELKQAAFEILKAKCNVCHQKQNPRRVFSLENMEELAPRIYKQVFVKKRMPRGRKIKLTQAEYDTLQNWINSQSFIQK
ncbi:MAG: hypothetical protein R8P61_04490 [Bacteroidia bacterium]|nr:hypothetical protein [Bacteroidia bacterium]